MDAEVQAYSQAIGTLFKEISDTVRGLPKQALDWTPLSRDANSVAVIIHHVCGSARYWVYQGLTGTDIKRNREAEFARTAESAAELLELLSAAQAQVQDALARATSASLSEMAPLPGREPCTKRYALLHTIEHMATHLGHLQLTRQLWDARWGRFQSTGPSKVV